MTEIANQNIDIEVVETGGDTAQYFWHNTTDSGAGEGAGAHITEIPKEDFIDDPDAGGMNTLINTNGMAVRDGLTELGVFSAEQIRLGDFDGGNIVIVPTGFNINNAGIQFATFDTEDGIMLKTQEGADALSVDGAGELVTRTIKDVITTKYRIVPSNATIRPGTSSLLSKYIGGGAYPTDKVLTIKTSNIYTTNGTYSNHTISYSADENAEVLIANYSVSADVTINAYIVWRKIQEDLILRVEAINTGSEDVRVIRGLNIDVAEVSYQNTIHLPNISTDGHLYLYGHSTPVGDLMESTSDYSNTYSSGSTSFVYPAGNGTYSSRVKLPAGRWVITATIRIETLTSGAQYGVGVGYGTSKTSGISLIMSSRNIVTAGSTSAMVLNTTHLADASGDNYYSVGLYHGGKATVTDIWLRAMRVR